MNLCICKLIGNYETFLTTYPELLAATSFEEDELEEFAKNLDKDILSKLEYICKLSKILEKFNISNDCIDLFCYKIKNSDFNKNPCVEYHLDYDWIIMNKILDMMFFLCVDEKVIKKYEEYMTNFYGCYVTKKDGTEYYFFTSFIADITKRTAYRLFDFDFNLLDRISKYEILKDIDNFKHLHFYSKKPVKPDYDTSRFPYICTTKCLTSSLESPDYLNNYLLNNSYYNKEKSYFSLRSFTYACWDAVYYDIKVFNNNINYENPTILSSCGIINNASGYITVKAMCYDEPCIVDINKYRYLECSYFILPALSRHDWPVYDFDIELLYNAYLLDGKARMTQGFFIPVINENCVEKVKIAIHQKRMLFICKNNDNDINCFYNRLMRNKENNINIIDNIFEKLHRSTSELLSIAERILEKT